MRTGRPSQVKWTPEQLESIRTLYPLLGPTKLAAQLNVPYVVLMNKANSMGVRNFTPFEWTNEKLEVLKTRYKTEGPAKLSNELGIPYWTLLSKASRMGITTDRKLPPKGFKWTPEKLEQIKNRYVNESSRQLAPEFGVGEDTVRAAAVKLGLRTIAGHAEAGKIRAENSTSCDIHYFDKWSPNMAYILGFAFADGCMDSGCYSLSFNLAAKDVAVLEFMKKELKSSARIVFREGQLDKKTGNIYQPQTSLIISSAVMMKRLLELGLKPRKTFNNDPYPEIPDDMLPHFARGNLDGDGCISICHTGVCSVSFSGPINFIEGLKQSLIRILGLSPNKTQISGHSVLIASITWGSLWDLETLFAFLYPEGYDFCLERKRRNLVKWLSKPRWGRGHFFGKRRDTPLVSVS